MITAPVIKELSLQLQTIKVQNTTIKTQAQYIYNLFRVKIANRPIMFNPFSTDVLLLYPLKTSDNLRFSDVFRGYRSGTLVENRLIPQWFCVPSSWLVKYTILIKLSLPNLHFLNPNFNYFLFLVALISFIQETKKISTTRNLN